jgi:hypothetical protein
MVAQTLQRTVQLASDLWIGPLDWHLRKAVMIACDPLTCRNRSRVSISRRTSARNAGIAKLPSRCTMCGAELGRSTRKYCDVCLPVHTASKLSEARAHQLTLRETGKDKRSSPENKATRSAATRRQNAINREWKAKHPEPPNPQAFRDEILPSLKGVSLSKLTAVSGLSRSACQKIRARQSRPASAALDTPEEHWVVPDRDHWYARRNLAKNRASPNVNVRGMNGHLAV